MRDRRAVQPAAHPKKIVARRFGRSQNLARSRRMGKFRDHTIEEKRKLRNARQKRKRKQRVLEKKRLEGLKSQKLYEDQLKREAKLRETLRGYCRQWRQKCVENNRLKERLKKSTLRPEVCYSGFQKTLPLICMSLNKNSLYRVLLCSSKNADQGKQ